MRRLDLHHSSQFVELTRVFGQFGLAKFPAATKRISKSLLGLCQGPHARKNQIEMMLQEVLQQTRGNSIAQVFLGMSPLCREAPEALWNTRKIMTRLFLDQAFRLPCNSEDFDFTGPSESP